MQLRDRRVRALLDDRGQVQHPGGLGRRGPLTRGDGGEHAGGHEQVLLGVGVGVERCLDGPGGEVAVDLAGEPRAPDGMPGDLRAADVVAPLVGLLHTHHLLHGRNVVTRRTEVAQGHVARRRGGAPERKAVPHEFRGHDARVTRRMGQQVTAGDTSQDHGTAPAPGVDLPGREVAAQRPPPVHLGRPEHGVAKGGEVFREESVVGRETDLQVAITLGDHQDPQLSRVGRKHGGTHVALLPTRGPPRIPGVSRTSVTTARMGQITPHSEIRTGSAQNACIHHRLKKSALWHPLRPKRPRLPRPQPSSPSGFAHDRGDRP